ncbi:MAG: PLDc N-terminal domain-containing protein [Syntrophobacteraceae bacterium]
MAWSCKMAFNPLNLLILMGIVLIPMIPTFWAIVDLPKRRFSSTKSKVIWFAVVSTLPCLGATLYFLLARRNTQPL